METWEWVVFIAMFVFGLGGPLWAGYMLGPPIFPKSQPNTEAVAKAFEEAKNKVVSAVAEVKAPDEVSTEKSVSPPEVVEQAK